MQPVENRWTKKRKAEEAAAIVPPANVVMQFQSDDGVKAGTNRVPPVPCCFVPHELHSVYIWRLQDHNLVFNTMSPSSS